MTVYKSGASPSNFGDYAALAPFVKLHKTLTQVGNGGSKALWLVTAYGCATCSAACVASHKAATRCSGCCCGNTGRFCTSANPCPLSVPLQVDCWPLSKCAPSLMHDVWVRVSLGRQLLLTSGCAAWDAAAQRADIDLHAPPPPPSCRHPALCSLPQLTGYIQVPGDDVYEFKLESADGSRFFINDQPVIDLGEPAYKCCRVLLL